MQPIIVEKPYEFVPPHRSTLWSSIIRRTRLFAHYLHRAEGVISAECRHIERLRQSLDAGHSVLLTPNHCRLADPMAMGFIAEAANCHLFAMASWHLFNAGFTSWAIRMLGAFSVNREGVDRQAISTAIELLENGERPLVIFPEGGISRTNDRLHALLDGVAFIARSAAKKRAKHAGGRVVIHPVALKYLFQGDIVTAADPVLTEIETRLTWRPRRDRPLTDRISDVGLALLALKELEIFGATQTGTLSERLHGLIDRLIGPLEEEWLGGRQTGPVVPRVKALRVKLLPDMVQGRVSDAERERRWRQLADIYLAQQLAFYPPDYLSGTKLSVDRLLETIERFEEDLTDRCRMHGALKAVIQIGEPIEVSPERDRTAKVDPLMAQIEQNLQGMLDELAKESRTYQV